MTKLDRKRKVLERKLYLINELANLGYAIDLNKSPSEYNLVDLEQAHINVKCRVASSL